MNTTAIKPTNNQLTNNGQLNIDLMLHQATLEDMKELAKMLIDSKLIPGNFSKPEEVVTVILKGRALGLHPLIALDNIYFINSRTVVSAGIMTALAESKNYVIKCIRDFEPIYDDEKDKNGNVVIDPNTNKPRRKIVDRVTTIRVYKRNAELGMVLENDTDYYWSEIVMLGLSTKDNYVKQPRNMLFIRCLTRALRRYASPAIMNLYEVSEIADVENVEYYLDEDGNVKLKGQ